MAIVELAERAAVAGGEAAHDFGIRRRLRRAGLEASVRRAGRHRVPTVAPIARPTVQAGRSAWSGSGLVDERGRPISPSS